MVIINFVVPFFTGQFNLCGVDDNDIIPGIDMGGINGFGFAADDRGGFAGHAPERFIGSVNHNPFFNNVALFGKEGFQFIPVFVRIYFCYCKPVILKEISGSVNLKS